jgi:hypothetical protein
MNNYIDKIKSFLSDCLKLTNYDILDDDPENIGVLLFDIAKIDYDLGENSFNELLLKSTTKKTQSLADQGKQWFADTPIKVSVMTHFVNHYPLSSIHYESPIGLSFTLAT